MRPPTHGHRLQQFLPFGRIIDLGEFLRQIQVIPADDAILDEPFAGFGHLLVFLLRLQEFTWIADLDRAREGVDMLDGAEHFFNAHAQHRLGVCRKSFGNSSRSVSCSTRSLAALMLSTEKYQLTAFSSSDSLMGWEIRAILRIPMAQPMPMTPAY